MRRSLVLLTVVFTAACSAVSPTPAQTPEPDAPTLATSSPQANPTARTVGAEDVVRLVLAASPDGLTIAAAPFPRSVGSQGCEILRGGPAPGKLLPAVCRTEVERRGSDYVVRFTQVWDARDFSHADDANSGDLLSYTWPFVVSGTGAVAAQMPFGNFPPQYVR